jgi:hypothetical protein
MVKLRRRLTDKEGKTAKANLDKRFICVGFLLCGMQSASALEEGRFKGVTVPGLAGQKRRSHTNKRLELDQYKYRLRNV